MAVALAGAAPAHAQSVDDVVVSPQASGRWLRAESQHVVVYSDENPEILRKTVADLEALDQLLRGLYGRQDGPPPRKFPIYLVRAAEVGANMNTQYRRFMPSAAVTALSLDVAEVEDIFAVVVRDDFAFFGVVDWTAGDDVVLGAYAFHFFSENFPFRQPRWLTKGAAIYYSSVDIQPKTLAIGRTPALFDDALAMRGLERIPDIIAETGDAWSLPERQRFDAQSALLVRYLWADPDRKARLATYLDRVAGAEGDPKAIWAEVFGQPLEALPDALRAFVRKEPVVTTLTRVGGPAAPIKIRRMPAGADDLILELQQMKTGAAPDRADLLSKIRKAAARRPDERYSRQALARAEITLGDRDKGEKLLTQLLAEDGDNLQALRLMGTSKLYRAAADKANRTALLAQSEAYLRKADAAEPNDYQTLFLLAQTMTEGDTPSPERLALLRRAVTLAPEVTKIRLVAAMAFLYADDAATAYQLLKPISADPNGGLAASQAKRVLDAMASVAAQTDPK
ncbi:MAG: hypothetical protein J7528_20645 [Caulobacter sp.]|nr:hypothetical protein [Caulobacter sp.]